MGRSLFFALCRHVTVGRHTTGSVWTSTHLPSQHIPPFTASQRTWEDVKTEKKDRFQYQPVIWLLRLDRIMPCRQTRRNLPLMKYDMCANGAPPPIQQPVITFQNKYTKRLFKKKKIERKKKQRQLLYFSGCEWGSNSCCVGPLRILTSCEWFLPAASHWMQQKASTSDCRYFYQDNLTSQQQREVIAPSCWWLLMGREGWDSTDVFCKHVTFSGSLSLRRFIQEVFIAVICWFLLRLFVTGNRRFCATKLLKTNSLQPE